MDFSTFFEVLGKSKRVKKNFNEDLKCELFRILPIRVKIDILFDFSIFSSSFKVVGSNKLLINGKTFKSFEIPSVFIKKLYCYFKNDNWRKVFLLVSDFTINSKGDSEFCHFFYFLPLTKKRFQKTFCFNSCVYNEFSGSGEICFNDKDENRIVAIQELSSVFQNISVIKYVNAKSIKQVTLYSSGLSKIKNFRKDFFDQLCINEIILHENQSALSCIQDYPIPDDFLMYFFDLDLGDITFLCRNIKKLTIRGCNVIFFEKVVLKVLKVSKNLERLICGRVINLKKENISYLVNEFFLILNELDNFQFILLGGKFIENEIIRLFSLKVKAIEFNYDIDSIFEISDKDVERLDDGANKHIESVIICFRFFKEIALRKKKISNFFNCLKKLKKLKNLEIFRNTFEDEVNSEWEIDFWLKFSRELEENIANLRFNVPTLTSLNLTHIGSPYLYEELSKFEGLLSLSLDISELYGSYEEESVKAQFSERISQRFSWNSQEKTIGHFFKSSSLRYFGIKLYFHVDKDDPDKFIELLCNLAKELKLYKLNLDVELVSSEGHKERLDFDTENPLFKKIIEVLDNIGEKFVYVKEFEINYEINPIRWV